MYPWIKSWISWLRISFVSGGGLFVIRPKRTGKSPTKSWNISERRSAFHHLRVAWLRPGRRCWPQNPSGPSSLPILPRIGASTLSSPDCQCLCEVQRTLVRKISLKLFHILYFNGFRCVGLHHWSGWIFGCDALRFDGGNCSVCRNFGRSSSH